MLIKVIKDSIIHKGEIYNIDDAFECDNGIAESLIERGFASPYQSNNVVEEPTIEEEEMTGHLDPTDLETYSYQDLKKLASDLGVSANGTKKELIERISAVEVGIPADAVFENEAEAEEFPNTSMPEE